MRPKKFVSIFIILSALSLIAIASFVAYVDPYMQYRKGSLYNSDGRYLSSGIIRNYDYNAAVIGSSLIFEYKTSYIDSILGWNSVKLSAKGLRASEYSAFLDFIYESDNELENVILDLRCFSFVNDGNSLPNYLYNRTMLDDYEYLLNVDVLFYSLGCFLSPNPVSMDNLYSWSENLPHGRLQVEKQGIPGFSFDSIGLSNTLNNQLRRHFSNSDITYYAVHPPYCAYWYAKLSDEQFNQYLEFRKQINIFLLQFPNVRIYDFQVAEEIVTEFDNYVDYFHYSSDISDWIIDQIQLEEYRMNIIDLDLNNIKLSEIRSDIIHSICN